MQADEVVVAISGEEREVPLSIAKVRFRQQPEVAKEFERPVHGGDVQVRVLGLRGRVNPIGGDVIAMGVQEIEDQQALRGEALSKLAQSFVQMVCFLVSTRHVTPSLASSPRLASRRRMPAGAIVRIAIRVTPLAGCDAAASTRFMVLCLRVTMVRPASCLPAFLDAGYPIGVLAMVDGPARSLPLILVIEDDPDIQRLITRHLRDANVEVVIAGTASDGFILFGERVPDLVMVDLNLPDGSGLGLVTQIRAASDVPVVVVTANTEERSLVDCLDAGADDYVTKPFRVPELLARVRSAMRRRPRAPEPDELEVGSIKVDLPDRRVFRYGREIRLTPTEYRLLVQLARHPNRVFTHGMLLTAVWGPEYADEPHILRVTLNRLRNKLGEPAVIENRPAIGYALVPEAAGVEQVASQAGGSRDD